MQTLADPPPVPAPRPHPSGIPSGGIPTADPQAALQFCRWLAASLNEGVPGNEPLPGAPTSSQGIQTSQPGLSVVGIPAAPNISVVIPVFNEQENITSLHGRLTLVLAGCEPAYEIVFVDDGSRDQSLELLHDLERHDQHVKIVELARNFGHQVAISAGLDHARGQGIIIMDADLQDPPEALPHFIPK